MAIRVASFAAVSASMVSGRIAMATCPPSISASLRSISTVCPSLMDEGCISTMRREASRLMDDSGPPIR